MLGVDWLGVDGLAGAAFGALGLAGSLAAIAVVKRIGVVDAPDEARKTQSAPVPRLGGVAILAGTLIGGLLGFLVFFLSYGTRPADGFVALMAHTRLLLSGYEAAFLCVVVAFLIGLWDDIWTANTKLKLFILAAACLAAAAFGTLPEALSSPWGEMTVPGLLMVGSALWLLVFINAVNFMDGSNGLAVGCLVIMLLGLAFAGTEAGDWQFSVWWFALIGAMIGFLLHNLSGALYVGDAGALGLGALFAALGLKSGLDVWTIATLALPFLVEVLMTLVWRAKHGRNLLEPHLDHAYQRLRGEGGWSHMETALLYWAFSASCAVAAYIGALAGGAAPFAIFWTLGLFGIGLWVRHRRAAQALDQGD
ncbi:MAG: hypothetical protein AAFY82_06490 [Pseudomonadota bacterium]